jgi:hypothetical protein
VRQVQNQMVHAREYYRAILKLRPGQADVVVRATSPPVVGARFRAQRCSRCRLSRYFFLFWSFFFKKNHVDTIGCDAEVPDSPAPEN